ncbi:MAG: sugar ABC transporter permease [Chromatiaceae bacterium]|nr:sugar ABC transporter permease [Chromatiaceae bacterium]
MTPGPHDRPQPLPANHHPPSQLTRQRTRTAWLFLAPLLVVMLSVAVWPLLRSVWFSLTDADLSLLDEARFIGVENYLVGSGEDWYGILADPQWWAAVWNTVYFALVSVSIETALGLIIALVLNATFRMRGLVRAAVLIPWAIPTIVSAKIWGWMLHDQFGILNDLLLRLGLIEQAIAWTADPDWMMAAVILVDVWKTTPFMALLILAALQLLPRDCYEAARIDGVHPLRLFARVTLPLIRPALMVAVIFRLLDALRMFDLVYVLTPNAAETAMMSTYARQQLVDFQQVGYGSAATTVMFFLIAMLTMAYITLGRVRLGAIP